MKMIGRILPKSQIDFPCSPPWDAAKINSLLPTGGSSE